MAPIEPLGPSLPPKPEEKTTVAVPGIQHKAISKEKKVKPNFRDQCRTKENQRPLYVHRDTVSCAANGCVACAYKIVV